MLIISLLLPLCALSQASNVHISGTSSGAAGKTVSLYAYSDMLTMEEVLCSEAVIDDDGRFELTCYANYPRLVYVQAERYSQSFYVEPGRSYNVYIPQFDWSVDERRNVYLDPVALPLEFVGLPDDELNLKLMRFEEAVDRFIGAHRVQMDPRYKPQRRYKDSLEADLRRQGLMADADSESFYSRYVRYTLASMWVDMKFASRAKTAARYIADQPVRYYDEQYMRLFLGIYADALSKGTRRIGVDRMVEWVSRGDVARYLDSVGLDPMLRNEQVRELAVLEALKESYFDARYDRGKVLDMIGAVGRQSRFDEHKALALRLVRILAAGERGGQAEPIALPDVDRRTVNLDSLAGKWLYVAFVRTDDPNSLAEVETMAHFHDSVCGAGRDVEFVCVACDREFQKMYHLLKNSRRGSRYNWLWLHFDGNYRLLERYGVVSYPTFVLINPEGKLHYDLTPAPASGLLLHGPWEKRQEEPQKERSPLFR